MENNPKNYDAPAERILTVREMDPDLQPRERAMKYGCGVLPISDLLALILRTGTRGNPVTQLTRDIMGANNRSLHRLEKRDRKEMLRFPGLGMTKVIQIEAIMELIRRYNAEEIGEQTVVTDSKVICDYMHDKNANKDHEEMWAIYTNRRNAIIHSEQITSGTSVGTMLDLKRIIKVGLMEGAEAIILCHNHPSGNMQPSPQDDNVTRKMREACETMDMRLLDHVIVSGRRYYSYHDEGRL